MPFSKSIVLTAVAAAAVVGVVTGADALTREEARARAATLKPAAQSGTTEPDPTAPWQVRFDAIDADHDGRLTPGEAHAHAEKLFKAMDTDHDGKVTAKEYTTAHTPKPIPGIAAPKTDRAATEAAAAFGKIDRDHDGTLSLDEVKAATDAHFTKADVNKRGSIFRWEFRRFPW